MKRIGRRLSWLAYGLAPRSLAAIFVLFDVRAEASEASERQAQRS